MLYIVSQIPYPSFEGRHITMYFMNIYEKPPYHNFVVSSTSATKDSMPSYLYALQLLLFNGHHNQLFKEINPGGLT